MHEQEAPHLKTISSHLPDECTWTQRHSAPRFAGTMLSTNNKMLNTNNKITQMMSEVREPWRAPPCPAAPVAGETA
eukprot:6212985-Prymnesium_polylepis.3